VVNQSRRTISVKAFVDLGVINIVTAWIEGEKQPIAFSGKPLLADWWYWNKKIAYYQSIAKSMEYNKENQKILPHKAVKV